MTLTYLTYLEPLTGVYRSQVLDVCDHLEQRFGMGVTLIAAFSPRNIAEQREKLGAARPGTRIVAAPLGWRVWPLARRVMRRQIARALPGETRALLCRGAIAAVLAQDLRRAGRIDAVGYDGRGAFAAEWSEYEVAASAAWRARIAALERDAVIGSDTRLAVSQALVEYWRDRYGYSDDAHAVIPCTLSEDWIEPLPAPEERRVRKMEMGFDPDHRLLCYSGSAAEWQSIAALDGWLDAILSRDPRVSLLLMTPADVSASRVVTRHGDRVKTLWTSPDRVRWHLQAADHGLLVREASVTNQVAAPTKFAEYLAAGLSVIISPGLGDYSDMVAREALGMVCDIAGEAPAIPDPSEETRARLAEFAAGRLSKAAFDPQYAQILQQLGTS